MKGLRAGSSGNSSQGVVIVNPSGTDMTARDKLQFTGNGITVTDDSTNGKTVVNVDAMSYFGICSTDSATAAKTATIAGFPGYKEGQLVNIRFGNDVTGNCTLNINGYGARNVRYNRGGYGGGGGYLTQEGVINKGSYVLMQYFDNGFYIVSITPASIETWTSPVTASVGATSVTISHSPIVAPSHSYSPYQVIRVFSQNASQTVVGIKSVVTSSGQAVITFNDPLEEATDFRLKLTYI